MMEPEVLVEVVGRQIVHGSLLAAVTWLLCLTVLRRFGPAVLAAFWTIVLLKFLVPPILPGMLSWSDSLDRATEWGLMVTASSTAPGSAGPALVVPSAEQISTTVGWLDLLQSLVFPIGIAFYSLGLGWALRRTARKYLQMRRFLRQCPAAGSDLTGLVNRLCLEIGLRRPPRVLVTAEKMSPFVVGVISKKLVLSEPVLEELTLNLRKALILHELAHIRRGDLMVRLVQEAASVLLFFWPPVYWVCRQIERTTEMACDQLAVAHSKIVPTDYAETLLRVVKSLNSGNALPQRLAFARKSSFLEERFEMILTNSRYFSKKSSWMTALLIGAWAVFSLPGGLLAEEPGSQVEKQAKVRVAKLILDSSSSEEVSLRSDFCPEADADGDGTLTLTELRAYAEANSSEYSLNINEQMIEGKRHVTVTLSSPPGPVTEISELPAGAEGIHKLIVLKEADGELNREQWLQEHPDADKDGNGELSDEELLGYMMENGPTEKKVVMIKAIKEGESEVEDVLINVNEVDDSKVLKVISEDGGETFNIQVLPPGEGEVGLLKLAPGDKSHVLFVREASSTEGESGKKVFTFRLKDGETPVELDSDGDGIITQEEAEAAKAQMKWVVKTEAGAESPGDVQIFKQTGEDGTVKTFVVKQVRKAEQSKELSSAERRAQFLKAHPEADLNGDGEISSEESAKFAASLQEKKAKKEIKPEQ